MASTRDRIIAATNELFRRHGYNGTSLSQISKASNTTIGSIYHFFPGGKEALTVAVIETTGVAYRDLFEIFAADASEPAVAFENLFTGAAATLRESEYLDPCPIGTIAREVASTNEPIRLAAAAAFDSWITAATSHLKSAGVHEDEALQLATLFVSTLEGNFVISRTMRTAEPLLSAGRLIAGLADQAISRTSKASRP